MHPEITAMAAAEHVRDMRADAASRSRREHQRAGTTHGGKNSYQPRPRRAPLRKQTGWALVALGLRIAASGSR